jgi:hypothetical protein
MIQQRKRKGNNLAQSLGRMAHVKGKTVTWLKSFDKQFARDAPYSVFLSAVPSSTHLLTCFAAPPVGSTVITSPMLEWPSAHCCLPVHVTCSFCNQVLAPGAVHVTHNYMLPRPFVLTCHACLKKHAT